MDRTPTQSLLDFICSQEKDLAEYMDLVQPLEERFLIFERGKMDRPGTVALVERVIQWEKGSEFQSLEEVLNNLFVIHKTKRGVILDDFKKNPPNEGTFFHAFFKN